MEQAMRERGQDKGRTGSAIGANVRRARERLGVDLAGLALRLTEVGWPIPKSALSRLENGQRRVDVDDLMALAVVLYVSPLELLLGTHDHAVTPTAVPQNLRPEEIWAWASGDVELDPGEMVAWWRNRIAMLQSTLDGLKALEDDLSSLPSEAAERRRRWLAKEIADARQQWQHAVARINELAGEGEIAGVSFDIPDDPTVAMTFGQGDHGVDRAEG